MDAVALTLPTTPGKRQHYYLAAAAEAGAKLSDNTS